jgi:thioredoxin 1
VDELDERLRRYPARLAVLYFMASWCSPCKTLEPGLMRLAASGDDFDILRIDTEELEDLAARYGIDVLPTEVFQKGQDILTTYQGANIDAVTELVNQYR